MPPELLWSVGTMLQPSSSLLESAPLRSAFASDRSASCRCAWRSRRGRGADASGVAVGVPRCRRSATCGSRSARRPGFARRGRCRDRKPSPWQFAYDSVRRRPAPAVFVAVTARRIRRGRCGGCLGDDDCAIDADDGTMPSAPRQLGEVHVQRRRAGRHTGQDMEVAGRDLTVAERLEPLCVGHRQPQQAGLRYRTGDDVGRRYPLRHLAVLLHGRDELDHVRRIGDIEIRRNALARRIVRQCDRHRRPCRRELRWRCRRSVAPRPRRPKRGPPTTEARRLRATTTPP